jgi:hypothetical protein
LPPARQAGAGARPARFDVPRWTWLLFGLVMTWSFVSFWARTVPVRLANPDDVDFQQLVDAGQLAADSTAKALHQGRFYPATPLFPPLLILPYSIREPWSFSLLRTLAFFLQAGLTGALIGRLARSAAAGAATSLLIVVTLHFPPTFYPVLSYPPAGLGFIALLVALHAHLTAARGGAAVWRAVAGAALLVSCLCLDLYIVLLPGFAVLSYLAGARTWRSLARELFVVGATALAYVTAYAWFAHVHPSHYQGTRVSLALGPAGGVLLRQFIGILPGFELVVNRIPECAVGPLFRPVGEALALVRANTLADAVLSAGAGLTVARLLTGCGPWLGARAGAALLLAAAIGLNLPIAFAEKYQVFIYHRQFPYEYAFHASCLLAGAVVVLVGGLRVVPRRRWVAFGTGFAVAAACFSAQASNRHVLAGLQQTYNAAPAAALSR